MDFTAAIIGSILASIIYIVVIVLIRKEADIHVIDALISIMTVLAGIGIFILRKEIKEEEGIGQIKQKLERLSPTVKKILNDEKFLILIRWLETADESIYFSYALKKPPKKRNGKTIDRYYQMKPKIIRKRREVVVNILYIIRDKEILDHIEDEIEEYKGVKNVNLRYLLVDSSHEIVYTSVEIVKNKEFSEVLISNIKTNDHDTEEILYVNNLEMANYFLSKWKYEYEKAIILMDAGEINEENLKNLRRSV
jgi:hypothetical protein